MSHPFGNHKESVAGKRRAAGFLRSGGRAHSDAAADKKLISKMLKSHEKAEGEMHGGAVTGNRLDRNYKKGGRVNKKTNIVININKDKPEAAALPIPLPPPGLIPPPPAGAPLGAGDINNPPPPAGGPPLAVSPAVMPPPGKPPGAKRGGRIKRAAGGRAMHLMKPLQLMRPVGSLPMPGRSQKFKSGGYISGISSKGNLGKWSSYAKDVKKQFARGGRMTGGAETGVGRLEKAAKYKRGS